MYKLQKFVSL